MMKIVGAPITNALIKTFYNVWYRLKINAIDAMQSDDDSISALVDVSVFGCYFQFGTRYSVDVTVLFNQYGLNEIGSGRWRISDNAALCGERA